MQKLIGILFFLLMSCSKKNSHPIKENKDLRICLRNEPVSLDPRKGNDVVASQIQFMLFEGLVCLNPDMSISLGQADSYELSSDGKTYIFHLKDTLWSDGTPVTAFDFEQTWKSILSTSASPDAYLLFPIKNAKLARIGKIDPDQVGIYAKNEKTLIVELEVATPYFLQILASSVFLPINIHKEALNSHWACTVDLVSNGPFQLKQWDFNTKLVLEKNVLYHKAETIDLDRIIVDIMDRETAILHLYESEHYDLVGKPLSFFPHELTQDVKTKNRLHFFPVAGSKFLAFNTSVFPFQNVNIRRAFGLSISRKELIEHVTKLNENIALNIIPPILLSENISHFIDGDILKAREHLKKGLAELQIERIEPIEFMYVSSEINHILAQALQHMWLKALGVHVGLKNMDFKTLHERSTQGDFNIGLFAWLADYADPMSILERFTDRTNHRNYSKWENEHFNHCLQAARTNLSHHTYLEQIKIAEQILLKEMPLTCLFHENYAFLIQPHVQNFTVSPLGRIYFDRIHIDLSKKHINQNL